MDEAFRIGISPAFKSSGGDILKPVFQEVFGAQFRVGYHYLPLHGEMVLPEEIADCDAIIALESRFTEESFSKEEGLTIIARWGVGYDTIDVKACTEADVLLATTPDAVCKPVAESILTFMLALAKTLLQKDLLVRNGGWDKRGEIRSVGLSGKTFGSVGIGNIGREMFRLLHAFDPGRLITWDPYVGSEVAEVLGVEMVDIETVFRESDFVAINCPLSEETEGMIDARLLGMMKPTAYLVNTARGPIVVQDDLVDILREGGIAGAGLDVFEHEPLPLDHPLTQFVNVILSPHALAWTDNLYRGNGMSACRNVLTVLRGEIPDHTINPEVTERAGFKAKIAALRDRWDSTQKSTKYPDE